MAMAHAARAAVVVTAHPDEKAFDIVMDSRDVDIVMFESPTTAYARIKREKPAVVIVGLSFDGKGEFLLLTMLKLDGETAAIPIRTYADVREDGDTDPVDFDQAGASYCSSNCFQPS